jgi:CRISPR-associated protein Csx1
MNNIVIYQLGRLDTNFQQQLIFDIDSSEYKNSLSSFAIKEYFRLFGSEARVKLIFPVSLPFNNILYNNENFKKSCTKKFYEKLYDAFQNPKIYLENPEEVFKEHPHTKEAEYLIIPSLGSYLAQDEKIHFNCYYADIVLLILIDMIETFFRYNEKIGKVIIDISSGHNNYVSAMIEALKHFDAWLRLYKWHDLTTNFEIAVSEPILPSYNGPYKISFEKQKARVFFSSPISSRDIENTKLARELFPENEDRSKKKILNGILESFGLVFSAIKNNSPLYIYTEGYKNTEDLREYLAEFLLNTKNKITKNFLVTPNLNKNNYLKVFHTLGFYMGLSKNLKENGVIFCLNASENVIFERLKHCKDRPLLQVENPEERIRELLDSRKSLYEKADFCINTEGLTPEQVAEKIIERFTDGKT